MKYNEVIKILKSKKNLRNIAGMARFGINPKGTLGISTPFLKNLAKKIGKDHTLAERLWNSGIHEAKILAVFIDDPKLVTEEQFERWIKKIDSWDVCDQVCGKLFDKTDFAYSKAIELTSRKPEFEKRVGFVLMASLAVHNKTMPDAKFKKFFPLIKKQATDERNFVKKAVNWALRQIGKRNLSLRVTALKLSNKLRVSKNKCSRWIGSDAYRELSRM